MLSTIQAAKRNLIKNADCHELTSAYSLREELEKGILSMNRGEVYTIEEAWHEIDAP